MEGDDLGYVLFAFSAVIDSATTERKDAKTLGGAFQAPLQIGGSELQRAQEPSSSL